jgi:stage III sporulation protein AB
MILKILGSIIIITASSFIGYYLSFNCSKRPLQLKTLQGLIKVLENEIRFLSSYIPDAFKRIYKSVDSPVAEFFKGTVENLNSDKGLNASQAWEMSISKNIFKTALNKEDKEILISFGKMLGNSDLEGQIKNIGFILNQLDQQEKKAEEIKKKNETLYRALGFLGGVAIILLFSLFHSLR